MNRSLYIAAISAHHNTLGLASHANNLANVENVGFKRDFNQSRAIPIFGAVLASRVFALSENPATDFSKGQLQQTDNELDISVNNNGLFAVKQVDGTEGYLSSASLQINANGDLLTHGMQVLDISGEPINLPNSSNIAINANGTISIGNLASVAQIKLVNPNDQHLTKNQQGLFVADNPLEADPSVTLSSGTLEQSNVNAVSEMTNILEITKNFELNLKIMHAADENNSATTKLLAIN